MFIIFYRARFHNMFLHPETDTICTGSKTSGHPVTGSKSTLNRRTRFDSAPKLKSNWNCMGTACHFAEYFPLLERSATVSSYERYWKMITLMLTVTSKVVHISISNPSFTSWLGDGPLPDCHCGCCFAAAYW